MIDKNRGCTDEEREVFSYFPDHIVETLSRDDLTDLFINVGNVFAKTQTDQFELPYESGLIDVVINEIASLSNTVINQHNPILECMFAGFRITATIFPVTQNSTMTFRKPNLRLIALEEYVKNKQLTESQFQYLVKALADHKNILVVGGTGTGKTTFANAMIQKMAEVSPKNERILILEDTDEIQCSMPNKLKLLTSHAVDMNRLLITSLRQNPERILVGEVRDKAALEMLKCWNTGHPGGITTIHANGCQEALQRLIDCAMEAGIPAPYSLVRHTINTVIFIKNERRKEGYFRYVDEIAEVEDFFRESQTFKLKTI